MNENAMIEQLRNNVDEVVGCYLNGQMGYGDEDYPNITAERWWNYCVPDIYNMKNNGHGTTVYCDGICDNLKFLGNDTIMKVIVESADRDGLLEK